MTASLPERPTRPLSRAELVAADLCIGCGACAAGPGGGMRWDRYGHLKPAGPRDLLRRRSTALARTCPFSPSAEDEDSIAGRCWPEAPVVDSRLGRFQAAFVGNVAEPDYRADGSSGGLVSWVAAELLRRGLVDGVAHVVAADPKEGQGLFRYRISRTVDAVREGAKSRYHPVELSSVLDEIRAVPGRYAVVGIPCFVKAVNLQRAEDPLIKERIAFTLGLFCGHMKSARFVDSFAWQMGVEPAEVAAVDYRLKDPRRPANWYTAGLVLADGGSRSRDWWHLADGDWGAGFFQNAACDWCDDVVAETADIAFGDAWVEPYASDGRGTNVVLARAPALAALLRDGIADGRLQLKPVDADFVARTQDAGLRHRREGLAWRLARRRRGLVPVKRVAAGAASLPLRRRLVYRMRRHIARWSHRIFLAARVLRWPALYLGWARIMLGVYRALAWSHGRLGAAIDRLGGGTGAAVPNCSGKQSEGDDHVQRQDHPQS